MRCLVCDFGGSSLKYALVDEKAIMSNNGRVPAPLASVEQFQDTVEALFNRYKEDIEGIAISMPGYIDSDTGYLSESGAYSCLYGKNIIEVVSARCPVNIAVENDGKCGALAEAWNGALSDCKDGAVVILGSGVGGGIIKDKKIHKGKNAIAGEFSYLITDQAEMGVTSCSFMSLGMLGVTYKICKVKNLDFSVQDSADAIAYMDTLLHSQYPKPIGTPKKIKADGKKFIEWVKAGDEQVVAIYKDFICSLAVLVHNIQICHAPDRIVIGGGLSNVTQIFTDLKAELELFYKAAGLSKDLYAEVIKSEYAEECNLLGAMYNYLTHYGGM